MVIAIIAILMSILMPALDRAKEQAKGVICRSHLHQWGLIWKMITDDHDGNFFDRPTMIYWQKEVTNKYETALHPDMWLCPVATTPFSQGGRNPYACIDDWDNGVYYKSSYGVNLYTSNENDPAFWKTPNRRGASYGPVFFDSMEWDVQPEGPDDIPLQNEHDLWQMTGDNELQRICLRRHGKYFINVLFMDWSVKRRTVKEMWRVEWSTNWDTLAPVPNSSWPGGGWPAWLSNVPEPVY